MREILFRGKRVDNGEWVEGFFWKDIWGDGESCYIHYDTEDYKVNPTTVVQYANAQAKNGEKIFEGDIVQAPWWRNQKVEIMKGLIEFSKGAFSIVWQDTMYGKYFAGYVADMEVIGNIFDNPELWEE